MESLNENQLSFTRAGDRRLWHRYHRVLPNGIAAGDCQRRGRFNTGGGNADQCICHRRHGRRAADDSAAVASRPTQCADFSDGDLHRRQPAVIHCAGLHYAAAVAHYYQPQPRRLFWPGVGGGGQRGAQAQAGQRGGHHVYGPHHR